MHMTGPFMNTPGSVLLLSGLGVDCARYSIAGWDPILTFKSRNRSCTLEQGGEITRWEGDPLSVLEGIVNQTRAANRKGPITFPFWGGMMGYLSYELKGLIEDLPENALDDLGLPHMYWVFPSKIALFDHGRGTVQFFKWALSTGENDKETVWPIYDRSCLSLAHEQPHKIAQDFAIGPIKSNFTKEEYLKTILRVQDYILEGDIYQVNLSQRFEADFSGNPFSLFQVLFRRNPAPFYAYIHAIDHHVLCTSMERFLFCDGNLLETRPIKGTRPRGKTRAEDMRLREELLSSAKDDAELSMIVDLLRNDIGKVCLSGTVRVKEHKRLESYGYVHHLVSIVDGILVPGTGLARILRATFPGGSITGCPKIRAMEIIDELEPHCRHVYTGSIGYLGLSGGFDLNIAIRTLVIKGNRCYYGAGGGIVYDSDPEKEYDETLHKARGFLINDYGLSR